MSCVRQIVALLCFMIFLIVICMMKVILQKFLKLRQSHLMENNKGIMSVIINFNISNEM